MIFNETLRQIKAQSQLKPVPLIEQLEEVVNILITLKQDSILQIIILTNKT